MFWRCWFPVFKGSVLGGPKDFGSNNLQLRFIGFRGVIAASSLGLALTSDSAMAS